MAGAHGVDNLSSLRTEVTRTHESAPCLEIEARMPSEVTAISPLVDRLIRLIEESHCVPGEDPAVEIALKEALNNAVVHGNRMDPKKLVQVRCRCDRGKGVSLVVKDQGQGFDPNTIPDPLAAENLEAEHGRGILLMRSQMDQVSFECGGTEVHMRKTSPREPRRRPRSGNESGRRRGRTPVNSSNAALTLNPRTARFKGKEDQDYASRLARKDR